MKVMIKSPYTFVEEAIEFSIGGLAYVLKFHCRYSLNRIKESTRNYLTSHIPNILQSEHL